MTDEIKSADGGPGRPENKKRSRPFRMAWFIAAGLVLAVLGAVMFVYWSYYNDLIVRARSSAAQNLLQQLALAQVMCQMETGRHGLDWKTLQNFGFRPDPNIRLQLVIIDLDLSGHSLKGFIATANHAKGKKVYRYNLLSDAGVEELPRAKPLGEEFSFRYEMLENPDGGWERKPLAEPPISLIWARCPLPPTEPRIGGWPQGGNLSLSRPESGPAFRGGGDLFE